MRGGSHAKDDGQRNVALLNSIRFILNSFDEPWIRKQVTDEKSRIVPYFTRNIQQLKKLQILTCYSSDKWSAPCCSRAMSHNKLYVKVSWNTTPVSVKITIRPHSSTVGQIVGGINWEEFARSAVPTKVRYRVLKCRSSAVRTACNRASQLNRHKRPRHFNATSEIKSTQAHNMAWNASGRKRLL